MTSAGNDIVSLQATDSTRTQQQRFYSKILLPDEKALYDQPGFSAIPFENFVWLLWSIKESAYKFLKRHQPELLFTPVKFSVKQLSLPKEFSLSDFEAPAIDGLGFDELPAINGVIEFSQTRLYSRSLMYNQLIASLVDDEIDFENVCWGIKSIPQDNSELQSAEARKFLTNSIADFYNGEISNEKNAAGIPLLKSNGAELPIPASLSHHGHYVAYSFKINTVMEFTT